MQSKTGIVAAALLLVAAAVAHAQLPFTAWPLPKNRDSVPLSEFTTVASIAGNSLSHVAAKHGDFNEALMLHQSGGYAVEPERRVATAAARDTSAAAAARFWTMTRTEKRAGLFKRALPRLKQIFESEGVPANLVWLAEIESAFDSHAVSRTGAVGLFQLMPDTAMRFGLRIAPVDERKLPEKSARAAARYLKQLHQRFGCWALALAAYNAGEGRVERVMSDYDLTTFDELAPYLPLETQSYVPRVLAVASVRE